MQVVGGFDDETQLQPVKKALRTTIILESVDTPPPLPPRSLLQPKLSIENNKGAVYCRRQLGHTTGPRKLVHSAVADQNSVVAQADTHTILDQYDELLYRLSSPQ